MKLKNLKECFIYSQSVVSLDGEKTKRWKYKNTLFLNIQQDISELDRNSAGTIDYDRLKIRTDYDYDIKNNDGVSFNRLEELDGYTVLPPKYVVISNPKVGKTTTYTCERYHGE